MSANRVKIGWMAFATVLCVCLTIGFPIVSHNSPLPLEFRNNSITLVSVSLLLSVALGYWRFIRNTLGKIWTATARRIVWQSIENQMREYSSQIRILGLNNNSGTVNLILEAGSSNGISSGMMFDIVTDPGGEIYGEVQVVQIEDSSCTVSPANRINTEFWEKLEDRMKYDPSSPPNIIAKRKIPDGIRDFLKALLQKERENGY